MIKTGFETRVKVQQIVENQLPEFILDENPQFSDFLKQYYISQEYQSGVSDLSENLDQYINVDNLVPEVFYNNSYLTASVGSSDDTIYVNTTKGYPEKYGLLKIDSEIITYTGITTNTFTGCIRGFSGITSYHAENHSEDLVFEQTSASTHSQNAYLQNLSTLFLKEFFEKVKYKLIPGLEGVPFTENLNVGNFIKEARSLYESKGTKESFRILFNVLYGITPTVLDLENLLIKPSTSEYIRRQVLVTELISGDPSKLIGQTLYQGYGNQLGTVDAEDLVPTASGPISEVEIISRNNRTFYKISLFVGFEDQSLITGDFVVAGKTKIIGNVGVGASVITVDSTIGFLPANEGFLVCNGQNISYEERTVNQFLGCTGITTSISTTSDIRSDQVVYGYEDGNRDNLVILRVSGVLSNFVPISNILDSQERDPIFVKNLGEKIEDPESDITYKEKFFNSLIYNTSTRLQVKSFSGSTFVVYEDINDSWLKFGDSVDILLRGSETIVTSNATVSSISGNSVVLSGIGVLNANLKYDIRRNLQKAYSSGVPIEYGNNIITSDVTNAYNEDDRYAYIASNSLPSHQISLNLISAQVSSATTASGTLQDYDAGKGGYSTIAFTSNVPFLTGDEIYYQPVGSAGEIDGLPSGRYFVQVSSTSPNKIKLYKSRSFIDIGDYLVFNPQSGAHNFALVDQRDKELTPQKILRKFPLSQPSQNGNDVSTISGGTGLLINGTEVINYKSSDKIYYGPISEISILNGGNNFDVINPPVISVSNPVVSTGTTALIQPVVRGFLTDISIDPIDFDIEKVISVEISGGNGTGAEVQPILEQRYREVEFNAKQDFEGGGINVNNETIVFLQRHNFTDGEKIVYDPNGNQPLGVGNYQGSNTNQNRSLISGAIYYAGVINSSAIQLYESRSDYLSGINTVGFTTTNTLGIHKFRLFEGRTTISSLKVVNPGSGYENRKVIAYPSKVSTTENYILFENHGYSDGDTITYSNTGTVISGLSTAYQYKVIRVDNNAFRLSYAGVGGTVTENYTRKEYVKLKSQGSGSHIFNYPEISVNVNVSFASTIVGVITATPKFRGKIVDAFLYEPGSDYGSTILNFNKKPLLTVKNGKNAEFKPIILDGRIVRVQVQSGGSEYTAPPDLVVNSSTGSGCKLRAIVSNGSVTGVVVLKSGVNYEISNTNVIPSSPGSGLVLDAKIRDLTINSATRFNTWNGEVLHKNDDLLQYGVLSYGSNTRNEFLDTDSSKHSPIIGWAYDGNPIYGPYGYSNPNSSTSSIKLIKSSYSPNISIVKNRPSGFTAGFFVEDYEYNGSNDLDQHNGRYCFTPEFPEGTYAYFASLSLNVSTGNLDPEFPYFIGNTYRSNPLEENYEFNKKLSQATFDFNSSNLIRNTFPYNVNEKYSDNDFLVESNEIILQKSVVESVKSGEVTGVEIIQSGSGYKVGDALVFNEESSGGSGASARVSNLKGSTISKVETVIDQYNDVVFTWDDSNNVTGITTSYHNLTPGDIVEITGLSTHVAKLNGIHQIGFTTYKSSLINAVPANGTPGVVQDVYVSYIPENIRTQTNIGIGTEILTILDIFRPQNLLRVSRGVVGSAHTESTTVFYKPTEFQIPLKGGYFDSTLNTKSYFNPKQTVGLGTGVGIGSTVSYTLGGITTTISVLTQSIYIPNHPFHTNQEVVFGKDSASSALGISTLTDGSSFNLPLSGDSQIVYIVSKSKDSVGIKTTLSSNEVYFISSGSDSNNYFIRSNLNEVTGIVKKNQATVSVATSHSMQNGDEIDLIIKPNLSVGIGTSSVVRVQYNTNIEKILINPVGFTSTSVDDVNDKINITKHGFTSGDKVFYDSSDLIISGLETGGYFVYKVDDDSFKLSTTYVGATGESPLFVSIASTGGTGHVVSQINPRISVVKNNDLIFDLSHTSLSGFKFKLFYDELYNNEFVSTGATNTFSVSGVGTVGVSTNASLTVGFSTNLPQKLYYAVERSGFISTSDVEVINDSEILFTDSSYNGTYTISGIGSTTFNINLTENPEKIKYLPIDCDELRYTTSSSTATGGIEDVRVVFGGRNYTKTPIVSSITTNLGKNAEVYAKSTSIGEINRVRIINQGFEYSSDKTLRPKADVPTILNLKSANALESVTVVFGGSGYNFAPALTLVNTQTGQAVPTVAIEPVMAVNTIKSVNVIAAGGGLVGTAYSVFAENNDNGIRIQTVESSRAGIITCYIDTPTLGFSTYYVQPGDKIFVEGIVNYASGSGFNSKDNGYKFFEVLSYDDTVNPVKLSYSVSDYTVDAGLAKTAQLATASLVKQSLYPRFNIAQRKNTFFVGEDLLVSTAQNPSVFVESDLQVLVVTEDFIKVKGDYNIKQNYSVKGKLSGSIASINRVTKFNARFETGATLSFENGWISNTGKLNEDTQVIPDNDYYQNLSYTVKSPLEYDTIVTPVNRMVHPAGLKNFADLQVEKSTNVSTANTNASSQTIVIDVINENRVDTINTYDLSVDIDVEDNASKFVQLKNRKVSDYIECRTNRVLEIDDISDLFRNKDLVEILYKDLESYPTNIDYSRFLVQISNDDLTQIQASEIVVGIDAEKNTYTFEKGSIYNTDNAIAEINARYDDLSLLANLRVEPVDPYNQNYNIKVFRNYFTSASSGIGSTSIGFVNITGFSTGISSNTTSIVSSVPTSAYNTLFATVQVIDNTNSQVDYSEVIITHDGSDSYVAEYAFNSNETIDNISKSFIGTFGSSLSGGVLSLTFKNDRSNSVVLKARVVGFGSTAVGIGTYRFKSSGQADGSERSARLESHYNVGSGKTTVIEVDKETISTVKSIVNVSVGATSAIHQVLLTNSNVLSAANITELPFVSVGTTTGLGTFGASYSGSNVVLEFYPIPSLTGNYNIKSYNELLYTLNDTANLPNDLLYGNTYENLILDRYLGYNLDEINRVDFDLKYDGTPIFTKTFDPSNTSILNRETGVFTIANHFFNTGEELNYLPGSSFVGVSSFPVGIGLTLNHVGVVTNILPPVVYAVKVNPNQFKISTRKEYASAGIFVTFTDFGSGNAHTFDTTKKLEKSLIVVDGLVQNPISWTPINYTLSQNGGSIGTASTIFGVSGISSIKPDDLVKIGDEYMKVISVGFGTTSVGPITGIGTTALINVSRASVGSASSTHNDGDSLRVYRGSFNIVNSTIFFTDAPKGPGNVQVDTSNQRPATSSFEGRVYLRKDYANNLLFDDVSDRFTGVGATFNLTVSGVNTTGIETGSGVLFINGIFQTPTTENNAGNNYNLVTSVSGISSVIFSGITSSNGSRITVDYDVNQNQLPRGGVIVSLGFTGGLGFAPLVGAAVTSVINGTGAITSVGLGTTDIIGSGYYGPVSVAVTSPTGNGAVITALPGIGGTLGFTIVSGGTGYAATNTSITISDPSYENLSVTGVSRVGLGSTTDTGVGFKVTLELGPSEGVGIGSSYFQVKNFFIKNSGYSFKRGDVFKPVGLVTDRRLASPLIDCEFTVLETYTDTFASWQFGELDNIDSIASLQNGIRRRFPLYKNSQLLSFERNPLDASSLEIDLAAVLLIFVNGVIQKPGVAYEFDGGTSFTFTDAPKEEDNIAIFFYRGTRNSDSQLVNINETIKVGDDIQLFKNDEYNSTLTQDIRRVFNITSSDKLETNTYLGKGINENTYRPLSWTKQKVDLIINNEIVSKARDSIEGLIFPSSKVIKNFNTSDNEIFVDDAQSFKYEENDPSTSITISSVNGLVIQGVDQVSAAATAIVSAAGTITSISITDGGSGYVGAALTIKIAAPKRVGVGIGSTATATATISNGSIVSATVVEQGFGYSRTAPPQVIVPIQNIESEVLTTITTIRGFTGIVTGIATATGTSGHPLALRLNLDLTGVSNPEHFVSGYPFVLVDSKVGNGVTSVDDQDSSKVGIGSTFLDNIYYAHEYSYNVGNLTGIITSNILSTTNIVGIATTGDNLGRISWGKLSGFSRSSQPVSFAVTGYTFDVGLSTFPTIQRRGYGLRDNGAYKKKL